jgi:hypothetical protein
MKENETQELKDEEVEKILENTWKNLESRRRCEQTHIPNYIKKKEEKDC